MLSSTGEMLSGIPEAEQGGLGIIRIDMCSMLEVLNLSTYRVEQGRMIIDVPFEGIQKKLLLPAAYKIIGVFFDEMHATWHLLVRSERIPVKEPMAVLPKVVLTHYRDGETGMISLERIDIVDV